ncbi:MAG: hypothetical protein M0R34_08500 [Candidatus Marinimicrobia bacterium]|jgi:hypothetical protein|nr:hypothetical protein [Candidatus Neomarinimicrobiota bacterium]MCK9560128.1 hypothetical protein [Candidatus Neomarinimicrobiota bacterium]
MERKNIFDWKRLIHLIKNEVVSSYRSLLVSTGAVGSVLLVIYLLQMLAHNLTAFHEVWYPLVLFIGGFVISSKIFSVLHDRRQNYVYLTLPASDFEKLVSKLILSSVGWIACSALFYFIFSALAAIISQIIWGDSMSIFNPFQYLYLKCAAIFLVLQSLFIFGSIYFKKSALAKTIGSLFLFGFILALISGLFARIIFAKYIPWCGNMNIDFEYYYFQADNIETFARILGEIVKYSFWFLLAPFFWILSYIRLKEIEV